MTENHPLSDLVTSTGVPAILNTVRDFFEKLAGPAAEEMGLLVSDHVRAYRVQNQVTILNRAREFLTEAGLEPSSVPLRTLAPLLEGASLEEEETLRDMWAGLVANAATEDGVRRVPPAFPEIMRQLSPLDGLILRSRFVAFDRFPFAPGMERGRPGDWDLDVENDADVIPSLINLTRLGLVEWDRGIRSRLQDAGDRIEALERRIQALAEMLGQAGGGLPLGPNYVGRPGQVALTPLGTSFLRSCLPPIRPPIESPVADTDSPEDHRIWAWVAVGLARVWAREEELAEELAESAKKSQEIHFLSVSKAQGSHDS